MKLFKVNVEEILSRCIEVEANSFDEAVEIVSKMYRDEDIVLDTDDYVEHSVY